MSSDPPPENDVISAPMLHQHSERQLVECLVDCGEDHEGESLLASLPVEIFESVAGWERTVPNVKYDSPKKRRDQAAHAPAQTQDDIGISYYGNQPRTYTGCYSNRTTKNGSRYPEGDNRWPGGVSFPGESIPAWKIGVEPKSYRYMPNNGRYRASKLIMAKYEMYRPSRRVLDKLTPEQKQLQKEIQRELRKEFEMFNEYERLKKQGAITNTTTPRTQGCDLRVSRPEQKQDEFPRRDCYSSEDSLEDKTDLQDDGGRDYKLSVKVNAKVRENSFSPVDLPPIDIPLVSKSHNEHYLDKFRTRISALDEEIRRDQHIFRKSYDDLNNGEESNVFTRSQWNNILTNARNISVASQGACLPKPSPRLDIGKKLKNIERMRNGTSSQQRNRNSSDRPIQVDGATGGHEDSVVPHVTKPQPINGIHGMPAKIDTLTEETFKVRKIQTFKMTPETRMACNYSNANSPVDRAADDTDKGQGQGQSVTDNMLTDRENLRLLISSAEQHDVNSCQTPLGETRRIAKSGHGSISAPVVLESTDSDDQIQNYGLSVETLHTGFMIPRATEMASTKESLQKLISASKLYSSAAGGHNRSTQNGRRATGSRNGDGRFFGEAFQSLPVGKGRPRRGSRKEVEPLSTGFLPEISGKRMRQATTRQKIVRS